MDSTQNNADGMGINQGSEPQSKWSQAWSEAGALVIRQHQEQKGWQLGEPMAADPDLNAVDDGYASFVTRFAQRRGHVAIGTTFEMAEAWGIEVEGDYALCSAADPNLVIWPRSSMAYLSNLIYLLQRDPDTLGAHEVDPDDDVICNGVISPTLPTVDVPLYNAEQPQTEPRWLPAVLCGERDGLGAKTRQAADGLGGLLAAILGGGGIDTSEFGSNVRVTVGVVDHEGNVTKLFGDGDVPDRIDLDDAKQSPNGTYHA